MEYLIKLLTTDISILNNLLLLIFFAGFGFIFWQESKHPDKPLNWADMLLDNKTQRLSLTKLGQFWGIIISSWIAIYMTQKLDHVEIAQMFPYIFATWLTFLVTSTGIKLLNSNKEKKEENQDGM
jgi:uncharacterized protein YacL